MMLPGISQIQSALIGMAAGTLLAGIGAGVLVHKIDNGRYEAREVALVQANAKALKDEQRYRDAFFGQLEKATAQAAALDKQLAAEREKKQTVLTKVLHDEGKKDAPLAACLARQLPADVLSNLAH